jgi:DNA-binding phage protein
MAENPVTNREMAPMPDVFGSEKNTPHAVFEKSRREAGYSGTRSSAGETSANHRPNDLAMACPKCPGDVRMWERAGAGYYCLNGHKWLDYDELMSLNPRKLPFKGIVAKQEGFTKVTLDVPGSVAEALTKKFGDKLAPTLSAVMDIISGSKFILMGENDVLQMTRHLGQDVPSSAFILGKVYELKASNDQQKETIDKLRVNLAAKRGVHGVASDSEVSVDLGSELMEKVQNLAASREQPIDDVIRGVVQNAIENDWA